MKFLLTNDDGIDAEGLRALAKAVAGLGEVVWAAPLHHYSGCSHQVTTDKPLQVTERGPGRHAVAGTPADCVRVALAHLAPDVDFVLSGINHGGNLGADVHISGTVAAVREAVLHGKPGIAWSQYQKRGLPLDWDRAARWVHDVLKDLIARPKGPGFFWNVNLPHIGPDDADPPVVVCPLETGPLPLSFRHEAGAYHYSGNYHQRGRQTGSDVDVCFGGSIAVSRIALW